MLFSVDRDLALNVLGHVQGVVERRANVPALGHVLLTAKAGEVVCAATNLDLECVESFPADVEKEGAAAAPAGALYDLLRRLEPGAQVRFALEADEGGARAVSVASGDARAAFPALPAQEFPLFEQPEHEDAPVVFDVAAGELKRLLRKTTFAAATEETRYYLNGVFFHAAPDPFDADARRLCAVATDGVKLAMAWTDLPESAEATPEIIVPRAAARELGRLLDSFDAEARIEATAARVSFVMGPLRLTTKVIEGAFPRYRDVLPLTNAVQVSAPRERMKRALARAEVIARAQRDMPLVRLSLARDKIDVATGGAGAGEFQESIAGACTGEPLTVGLNVNTLNDVVAAMEGEEAQMKFSDPTSPALALDGGDARALFVVMPTRL